VNSLANNDWQLVRSIFDDALRQSPEERPQFIRQACRKDESLQKEVESLLASLDSAETFLETPAVVQIVENVPPKNLLSSGQILGNYEVGDLIGSGGMGEVYLARDTRLNRKVAVKVLRGSFLPDAQANQRLLREARAAALLEHPNICQIYEIAETPDHCFIVMQYVVGKTLAEILAKGRLGTAASLNLGVQIADGLAEAHEQGIIHRDIKPANVIVNDKGQAKILDFGLAKFIEAETSLQTSQRLNSSGLVMGTVPFMSPEQLRGKTLDRRSDIFSLGALLYEMLSGQPAFTRDNNAEAIAAILNEEPDWSHISEPLRPILQKCLAKDKADRYESARILARDLEDLRNSGAALDETVRVYDTMPSRSVTTTDILTTKKRQFHFWQSSGGDAPTQSEELASGHVSVGGTRRFGWIGLAATAVVLLLLGSTVILLWKLNKTDDASNFDALRMAPLVSWKAGIDANSSDFRVSHDGKYIAYSSSRQGGNDAIYIKQTSDGEEFQVTKNPDWQDKSPLWSPNDQKIAFVSFREGKTGIYVSPTLSGEITPLLPVETVNISLRHWALDGSAIFFEKMGNLYRLDLKTSEVAKITPFAIDDSIDRDFAFSRDEKQIVFCDTVDGQTDIWTIPVSGGEPIRITNDKEKESSPLWHPDGKRIIYNVLRNDLDQINLIRVGGSPVQITRSDGNYVLTDVSADDGRIYYFTSEQKSDINSVDLDSLRETEVAADPAPELWADASPDGKSVVYQSNTPSSLLWGSSVWGSTVMIKSADGKTKQMAKGTDPRWLPDSRHVSVFRHNEETKKREFWIIDTVTGKEEQIIPEDVLWFSYSLMPITRRDISVLDFSPDGGRIVYIDRQKAQNVKTVSLNGGPINSLTKNENPNLRYLSPLFSRDGSRIALVSIEQFQDKSQKPVSRVQISESGALKDIFSTAETLRLIGWSSTGGVILTTAKGPIANTPMNVDIVDAALNGGNRKLFTLEDVYLKTFTLSPDGRTLAYTARRDGRDEIWTLALTGAAEEKKVVSNPNSALFLTNLAFSANGKTIYFDKQEETDTISVIENID
jgi:serine/threonine protein kinase